MDDEHLVTDAFVEVASSLVGGATGLLVAGPAGALSGAATAPAVRASVAEVVNRIRRRREERVEFVIQHAARLVNVSPRVLMEELESDANGSNFSFARCRLRRRRP